MSDDYRTYMSLKQANRPKGIGPSGVDGCFRAHAYDFLDVPKSDPRGTEKADLGTIVHLGWDNLIERLYEPLVREVSGPPTRTTNVEVIFPQPLRRGSADDVDWVEGVVRDVKTTSARGFQSWLDNDGPPDAYWHQVTVYAWGLNYIRTAYEFRTVGIVGIDREGGEVHEWLRPYDPDLGEALVEKMRSRQVALNAAAEVVASGADPMAAAETFPREGRGYDSPPCSWCGWRTTCLGPEDVQPEPEEPTDPEIIGLATAAAEDYLEARRERNKWADKMDAAKTTLIGLTGTFGTVKVGWGESRSEQVPDMDEMLHLLAEHDIAVPLRWSTRKGAIQVRRVRK